MKTIDRFILIILAVSFTFCLTSCSTNSTKEDGSDVTSTDNQDSKTESVSEDNFKWKDNIITGLTDVGAKQKVLVIPERCEGFQEPIFSYIENSVLEVSFESDKDIALNGAFRCASNLEKIFLPQELSNIDDMDFWACSNLQSISIPAGILEIGGYAFQDDTALKSVNFEGNITSIKAHAFDGCTSLEEISFPASVLSIEEYAFYGCTSLETVKLPETISTIGGFAFANGGLSNLYVPSAVEFSSYDTTSFIQASSTVSVYVVSDSWCDVNFEEVFEGGSFEKNYFEE